MPQQELTERRAGGLAVTSQAATDPEDTCAAGSQAETGPDETTASSNGMSLCLPIPRI